MVSDDALSIVSWPPSIISRAVPLAFTLEFVDDNVTLAYFPPTVGFVDDPRIGVLAFDHIVAPEERSPIPP